jgi:hypothetical protein
MHRDDSDTLLVLALAGESELVLRLSVWDLVDTEPLVGGPQQTWEVSLDIFDIVELWSQWVVDVDDDDLPVGLLLVEKSHDTKDLDLLDLTRVSDKFTDLADVQWVIVTLGLGLWVDDVGVLPGLERRSVGRKDDVVTVGSYLRECTVVPKVTLVGEAVADETELALLDVLLDGVEEFLLGDLDAQKCYQASCGVTKSRVSLEKQSLGSRWLQRYRLTSNLPLVHRGISTIMFKTVCCSLAYRGMSWKGEMGTPSFSM